MVDANPASSLNAGDLLAGKINYFLGNDQSKWHTNVPTYGGLTYSGLYTGIDLKYEGAGGQLKGTYEVAPGADPAHIRWRYEGADSVSVDAAGNLQVRISPLLRTPSPLGRTAGVCHAG